MQRVVNNLLRCYSYSSSERSLITGFELWEAMKPEGYVDPEGKYDQGRDHKSSLSDLETKSSQGTLIMVYKDRLQSIISKFCDIPSACVY